MTTSAAARFLGIDRTTVLKQVRAGKIAATSVQTPSGTQYTYTTEALEAYRANPGKPGPKPK